MDKTEYSYNNGSIKIKISGRRIQRNLIKAQEYLDSVVLTDCRPYIPNRNGMLSNLDKNKTVIGSGEVIWEGPYAHYQYTGKDMIGVYTKRHWAMRYEPKEYNGRALKYHTPGTGPYWFEKAKRVHGKEWIKQVKKIAGGR